MSAPPFRVSFSDEARLTLEDMRSNPAHKVKLKKVKKALQWLKDPGPSYQGLRTHKMRAMQGPNGEPLWNSYVENNTPAAWRILWVYDLADKDCIKIVSIGPHG